MKKQFLKEELENNKELQLIMLAPDPMAELRSYRYENLKVIVGQTESKAVSQYVKDETPILKDEEELKQRVLKVINPIGTEDINNSEQYQYEFSELERLAEHIIRCEVFGNYIVCGKRSILVLEDFFISVDINTVIKELSTLGSSDFGRKIQEYKINKYLRKCGGSELYRALKSRLSYVPALQVINQALRGDMPMDRRERTKS